MMAYIMGAVKIAVLVTLGFIFLIHIPQIIKFLKGEYKNMNKKIIIGKVMKWIGGFAGILGLAFYGGAFLAKIQGILLQIVPLAVAGTVCLVGGIICFFAGNHKIKNS